MLSWKNGKLERDSLNKELTIKQGKYATFAP